MALGTLCEVGDFISGIAPVVLAGVALWTAWRGLRAYSDQNKEKRLRWLTELQQRFVTEPNFQMVRREIYDGNDSDLAKAYEHNDALVADRSKRASDPLTEEERELLVALDDYVELFNVLAGLIREEQIDKAEAFRVFGWYALEGSETEPIATTVQRHYPEVAALRQLFKEHYRDVTGRPWSPSDRGKSE